jgi:hypothetical protein
MVDENSRVVTYVGIPALAIIVAVSIGYQVKMLAGRFEPAQHEQAMSWKTLEDAYAAMQGDSAPIKQAALVQLRNMQEGKITVYGYMFPIHAGEKHDHFLLTAHTLSCQFCFPSDVSNLVEVNMSHAIDYQRQPVLVTGTFAIGDSRETGTVYRIDDAKKNAE